MYTDSEKLDILFRIVMPEKKTAAQSKEELKQQIKDSILRKAIKRLNKNK